MRTIKRKREGYNIFKDTLIPLSNLELDISRLNEHQPVTTWDLCDEQEQNVYTSYGREMHTEDLGYDPSKYDGDDNLPLDVLEHFERRGRVKW